MTTLTLKDFEDWDGWDKFCARPSPFELAIQKKKQLLEMAKNGEDRPRKYKHFLAPTLINCTSLKNQCYDSKFTKEIKKLRPDWFITQSDIANQKKQKLLEMAKNGENRPQRRKHILGNMLFAYINPKNRSYDVKFTKKLKKLRPDWFVTRFEKADEKKQQLLKMAKNGEGKPISGKHFLGSNLSNYMTINGTSYDPNFVKQLKKIRPDWFLSVVDQKKQKLLEVAKSGESKPSCTKNILGQAFYRYINQNQTAYDPEFTKKIKKLRPDWFITQSDIANQKKQKLLEMAKNGEDKPIAGKHFLGHVFKHYTNPKKNYDPEFTKKIKKLRPDWFKK